VQIGSILNVLFQEALVKKRGCEDLLDKVINITEYTDKYAVLMIQNSENFWL
jgi:hypothetical protein